MKEFNTKSIRNICLLGHSSSGKTTLAEAMIFNAGYTDRIGNVLDGNTVMDFDPEETRRNISINTALAPIEWNNTKLNILDAPGYFDFVGEVKEAMRVVENAIIVVPAKSGIEVGTEKAWGLTQEFKTSRAFFISKLGEENANFDKTLQQLKDKFGTGIVAFELPIMEGTNPIGIVDILKGKAFKFEKGKAIEIEVPGNLKDRIDAIKEGLYEAIAETSEEFMEKYFSSEPFTDEEIKIGLSSGLADGTIVPVFCGSALANVGITTFLNNLVKYMSSPEIIKTIKCKIAGTDQEKEIKATSDEKMSALIFKTIADPFVGKISIFRVYSGTISTDMHVFNSRTEKNEKIAQMFMLRGKKHETVTKLFAGDIGAVAKLQDTNTNDTLSDTDLKVELDKIVFPVPALSLAVEPKTKGDEDKIGSGLHRLLDEDPTFKVEINSETRQTLISGTGDQHLDVIVSKLKAKFGVEVELEDPKVPYRETIKNKVKIEGKHKKQSGGHGQFGHVYIEFEPGESQDLEFEHKVFGGSVPKQYFPAVEKGLRDSLKKGPLAGYPVVNLKATLVDGSYHPVDSSEMAFKIAASNAFKKGVLEAGPILLEPIVKVEVIIPDNYIGDIMGDMNKRRGKTLGMTPIGGGLQKVEAEAPMAEMFKYATDLRSITQGRGSFTSEFIKYDQVPAFLSDKIIAQSKIDEED